MTNQTGFMSPQRMWVIAGHTFTQLSRMKVFYFLIIFAVLMIGVNFFELPSNSAGANSAEEHLKMVKNMSFGAMEVFSLLFGISATALLIPKDIEDRTLYTILSKPVPRIDYLFGKLLGVLLIILTATLVMDALLCLVVYTRANGIGFLGIQGMIPTEMEIYKKGLIDSSRGLLTEAEFQNDLAAKQSQLDALGVTSSMQLGILAIYLKTVVISSVALLLSTFSTSTLFTIIVTFVVWGIGMFQHEAKDAYVVMTQFGDSWWLKSMTAMIAVIFPDLHVYSITDSATQAKAGGLPLRDISKMLLISPMYTAMYTILSWFVFRKKEF